MLSVTIAGSDLFEDPVRIAIRNAGGLVDRPINRNSFGGTIRAFVIRTRRWKRVWSFYHKVGYGHGYCTVYVKRGRSFVQVKKFQVADINSVLIKQKVSLW